MQVWYMNGAGNDFMVIDARGLPLDFPKLAVSLCRRTHADGFLAVDNSEIADFKLHFYNSNGLRGEMCGNGARCVCHFAYAHGIAGERMTVETDAGLLYAWRCGENRYRIKLNNPGLVDLQRLETVSYVELGNPGIPHAVREIPDLDWENREALRPLALGIRHDTAFPKGVNVNFYRILDRQTLRILTFERGVEDYTLACGTGSASVAVVLWEKGLLKQGTVAVENPGGTLSITIEGTKEIEALFLEGETQLVEQLEITDTP